MALSRIEPLASERSHDPHKREAPSRLSDDEQVSLQRWLACARCIGVDAVEDLCPRAWPVPTDAAILGVFRNREPFASWLLVGQGGRWAVAACAAHVVLGSTDSLADALSLILRTTAP